MHISPRATDNAVLRTYKLIDFFLKKRLLVETLFKKVVENVTRRPTKDIHSFQSEN